MLSKKHTWIKSYKILYAVLLLLVLLSFIFFLFRFIYFNDTNNIMQAKLQNITEVYNRACVESMRFTQTIYTNLVEEGMLEPTNITEAMEQYKYLNVIKKYIMSENNVDSVIFVYKGKRFCIYGRNYDEDFESLLKNHRKGTPILRTIRSRAIAERYSQIRDVYSFLYYDSLTPKGELVDGVVVNYNLGWETTVIQRMQDSEIIFGTRNGDLFFTNTAIVDTQKLIDKYGKKIFVNNKLQELNVALKSRKIQNGNYFYVTSSDNEKTFVLLSAESQFYNSFSMAIKLSLLITAAIILIWLCVWISRLEWFRDFIFERLRHMIKPQKHSKFDEQIIWSSLLIGDCGFFDEAISNGYVCPVDVNSPVRLISVTVDGYSKTISGLTSGETRKLNSILEQKMREHFSVCIAEEDGFAVISNIVENNAIREKVNIIRQLAKSLGYNITAFVSESGNIYTDGEGLIEGTEKLKYLKFFYEDKGLFFENDLMENQKDCIGVFANLERKILSASIAKDYELIKETVNTFFEKDIFSVVAPVSIFLLRKTLFSAYLELIDAESHSSKVSDFYKEVMTIECISDARKLFDDVLKNAELKEDRKTNYILDRIEKYIDSNYSEVNLCIASIATEFKRSPTYIGRLYKQHKNKTINDYICEIRMHKSLELLKNSNKTIIEISAAVGYANKVTFYNAFKKQFGTTPQNYRENH